MDTQTKQARDMRNVILDAIVCFTIGYIDLRASSKEVESYKLPLLDEQAVLILRSLVEAFADPSKVDRVRSVLKSTSDNLRRIASLGERS